MCTCINWTYGELKHKVPLHLVGLDCSLWIIHEQYIHVAVNLATTYSSYRIHFEGHVTIQQRHKLTFQMRFSLLFSVNVENAKHREHGFHHVERGQWGVLGRLHNLYDLLWIPSQFKSNLKSGFGCSVNLHQAYQPLRPHSFIVNEQRFKLESTEERQNQEEYECALKEQVLSWVKCRCWGRKVWGIPEDQKEAKMVLRGDSFSLLQYS